MEKFAVIDWNCFRCKSGRFQKYKVKIKNILTIFDKYTIYAILLVR